MPRLDPNRTIQLMNHQISRPYPRRVQPRQEGITIPRTRRGRQKKARALRVLSFEKTSKVVFYSIGSRATPTGCAHVHPLASQKIPQAILPESPGGSGATPTGCARAHPLSNQKIPQTILPESTEGSGAPVGFINPGSLMGLLPSKSSAQQTTL